MKRQIKTRLSRILCIALILCMMLALIPAAFAETTEEAKDFSINFKDVDITSQEAKEYGERIWFLSDCSTTGSIQKGSSYGIHAKFEDVGEYIVIKFRAPATGNYEVTYDYLAASNGGYGDIYFAKDSETEKVEDVIAGSIGKKIFSNVCYFATSNTPSTSEEKPTVSLEEKEEYLLVFCVSNYYTYSEKKRFRMYLDVLKFTKQVEPGITINYNIGDIITAKKEVNYVSGGTNTPFAFADLFNYEETKGFFNFVTAYKENTNETTRLCCYGNFIQFGDGSIDRHFVLELNVPVKGTYSMKIDTKKGATAPVSVYLSQNTTEYTDEEFLIGTYAGIADAASTVDLLATDGTVWKKELEAGKYSMAFVGKKNSDGKIGTLGNLYLYTGGGTGADPVYMGALIKADKTVMNVDDIASLEVIAYMSAGNPADTAIEWESDNEAVATVNNGKVTAISSGVANISAVVTYNGKEETVTKVITVNDAELTNAFDDAVKTDAPNDYIAPTVDAIEANGIVGAPVPQADGSYKITAPETVAGKGEFLYWKKAMTTNEKIVSLVREFNYVPESEERNILVAVYEGDVTSTEEKCYNANGQYIPDAQPIDADLPSMVGYGKAYKWEQYKDTNVWVAQYEAETPIADIDVTVTGDNTSGGGTNLAYGAEVICKATGENFKCWKKTYGDGTAKIVSTDAEYTFNAWEDCTVTAIYEEHTYTGSKMKIIIDSFIAGEETGVMAEFLGFGNNVVEKGIMFEDNRIAMTTVGNQFSVIADEEGTYKGYVIVDEGTDGLKLITDGSYTKNAN